MIAVSVGGAAIRRSHGGEAIGTGTITTDGEATEAASGLIPVPIFTTNTDSLTAAVSAGLTARVWLATTAGLIIHGRGSLPRGRARGCRVFPEEPGSEREGQLPHWEARAVEMGSTRVPGVEDGSIVLAASSTVVVEVSMKEAAASVGVAEAVMEEEAVTDNNPALSVEVTSALPMAGVESRLGTLHWFHLHCSCSQILMLFSWSVNVDTVK